MILIKTESFKLQVEGEYLENQLAFGCLPLHFESSSTSQVRRFEIALFMLALFKWTVGFKVSYKKYKKQ